MIFKRLFINDVVEITPIIHQDNRGSFNESYRKDLLENFIEYKIDFCQENESNSSKGVFRGLHFQIPPFEQTKLIKVISGSIVDVIVDLRKGSSSYLDNIQVELSDQNQKQLLIPKGFAHGFLVTSNSAKISYKVDSFYNKDSERVINALDPKLNLNLDLERMMFSENDRSSPFIDTINIKI